MVVLTYIHPADGDVSVYADKHEHANAGVAQDHTNETIPLTHHVAKHPPERKQKSQQVFSIK